MRFLEEIEDSIRICQIVWEQLMEILTKLGNKGKEACQELMARTFSLFKEMRLQ
jgi:hypothetical protein